MTPYYCDLGRHVLTPTRLESNTSRNEAADHLTSRLNDIRVKVIENITAAAARQEQYANKHCHEVEFEIGQEVLVNQRYINPANYPQTAKKKLASKYAGPYKIIERIGKVAYRLDLPTNIKAHNVFHVHTLKLYTQAQDDRQPTRPPALIIDHEEEYEVETILDKRTRNRRTEYLVKWLGYPVHESSWEPSQNMKNAHDFIQDFNNKKQKQVQKNTSTYSKNSKKKLLPPRTRTTYRPPGPKVGKANNGRKGLRASSSATLL